MCNRKTLSQTQKDAVFFKYNGHCTYCGSRLVEGNWNVDHMVPLNPANGTKGKDIHDNRYPCCKKCNEQKANLTVKEFKAKVLEYYLKGEKELVKQFLNKKGKWGNAFFFEQYERKRRKKAAKARKKQTAPEPAKNAGSQMSETQIRVLSALKNGNHNTSELSAKLGLSKAAIRRAIAKLLAAKKVVKVGVEPLHKYHLTGN